MRTVRTLSPLLAGMLLGTTLPASARAGDPDELVVRARYLMGTLCETRAFGRPDEVGPVLDAALDRIAALEDAMTTWRPDGGLARLNRAFAEVAADEPVSISPELAVALASALEWAGRTGGAFDPTVGAAADAWGLRDGGRRPSGAEIAAAVARTSWRHVEVDVERGTAATRVPGVALDLGGFGKGFALDRAAEVLREGGIEAALIDFGGQVLAIGAPPGEPGWIVDVADPLDRARPVATLVVRDRSVATSGNAERAVTVDGHRHGHLLDPRTGTPVDTAGSATVIAPGATAADVLSTALAVAGVDGARDLLPPGAGLLLLAPPAEPGGRIGAVASAGLAVTPLEDMDVRWIRGASAARRRTGERSE